jgi:DNA repair exonuclease SbcCD ATPase subunit
LSVRVKQFIFGTVIAISLTLFGMGALAYIKRQQNVRLQQEISQLTAKKQTQINRHRQRLEELRKRLEVQPADKPAQKTRVSTLEEQLARISQRLDELSRMDPPVMTQIDKACQEIEQELQKITDDLDKLQGLLPQSLSVRDPLHI